ncbi:hypothetical protein [Gilvimarinus japonicus]|jgi:hypothetical protein|uniref:Uncharacterized protein n=1 Tax=Gilvimarinus japonicus TaxID=1796469 RepID=A0ABV7HQR1_9GAMM
MKKLAVLWVLLCLGSLSAYADNMYVKVTNNTGSDIYHLYVSSVGSDEWEEDVLDVDVLLDGETVTVSLKGYSNPKFDVQAEDEDGDTYTIENINVKKYDLVLTLDDMD